MSMLAERKRKTKWIINPTKKPLWTTDSAGIKMGKELMEKMGWEPGKGLGLKEQGMQEPLKVSYKNDTKGMGFKGNDEDWIEHQDEFNSLLTQLSNNENSSANIKKDIKSLEEKSRQSRARVHYQKFTRGKDLSRYSENDLACILGTNKSKKDAKKKEKPVIKEEENTKEGYETSFGVTTINSGSIQDYFKKKWIFDKSKKENENLSSKHNNNNSIENDAEDSSGDSKFKDVKKSKRKYDSHENTEIPEINELESFIPKKKKKIKDEKKINNEENENPKYAETEKSNGEANKEILNYEAENLSKRKKSKNRLLEDSEKIVVDDAPLEHQNHEIKKKKKRKKEKTGSQCDTLEKESINEAQISNNDFVESNVQMSENTTKKKKKKSKNKNLNLEESNSGDMNLINRAELECEATESLKKESSDATLSANNDFKESDFQKTEKLVKKKKKHHESKNTDLGEINSGAVNVENNILLECDEKKKRKKKKNREIYSPADEDVKIYENEKKKRKKEKEVDKDTPDIKENLGILKDNVLEKKKKKSKKVCNSNGGASECIEEDCLNTECENSVNQNLLNNDSLSTDSVKKKKKNKKQCEVEDFNANDTNNEEIDNLRQDNRENPNLENDNEINASAVLVKSKDTPNEEVVVHSHKMELFKKKKKEAFSGNAELLKLSFGFEVEKFKGSNLPELPGYGLRRNVEAVNSGKKKKGDCTCANIKIDENNSSEQNEPVVDIECSSHPGMCVLDQNGVCTKRENAVHCADVPLKALGTNLLKKKEQETENRKSCCKTVENKSSKVNCSKNYHLYKIDLNNSEDTGLIADKQCQTCGPDCSPETCSSRSRQFFISWDVVRTKYFLFLILTFVVWISVYSALSLTSNL